MSELFSNVTQFITGAADKVTRKTDEILAVQGLKGQIRTAQREVEKHYTELGKILYAKFKEGGEIAEEAAPHCEDLERLLNLIDQYKDDIDLYREKAEDIDWGEDDWDEEAPVDEITKECKASCDKACEEAAAACEEAADVCGKAEEAVSKIAEEIKKQAEQTVETVEELAGQAAENVCEGIEIELDSELEALQAEAEASVEIDAIAAQVESEL